MQKAEFDQFADRYEQTMERSCALSGESPEFYAEGRVRWCRERLGKMLPVEDILDYGCGIGGSFRYFFEILGSRKVIGLDPSPKSLQVAGERHRGYNLVLRTPEEFVPNGDLRLAFCNGVFHHISPADRPAALAYVRACLAADGAFVFWENNPWNPVVVYGMKMNEFDRNAQTLSPLYARRMLEAAGFRVESLEFCSFFPHFARPLRGIERYLGWLPIGAQYVVVARK